MKPTEFKLDYDETKVENLGRPYHFNPDDFLDVVEQMVASDELLLALEMLDKMPAFYRMYPTPRAVSLKKTLLAKSASLMDYINAKYEGYQSALDHENSMNPDRKWVTIGQMIDAPFTFPRAEIIVNLVKKYNEQGLTPHITEFGPSNFWLPHGLYIKGCDFFYYAQSLQKEAATEAQQMLSKAGIWLKPSPAQTMPKVFVCFETIEHLWNEEDIIRYYHAQGLDADVILFSTPCCTLHGGLADYNRNIEHVRSYTPSDILTRLIKWWPDHDWNFVLSNMMVFDGKKRTTPLPPAQPWTSASAAP